MMARRLIRTIKNSNRYLSSLRTLHSGFPSSGRIVVGMLTIVLIVGCAHESSPLDADSEENTRSHLPAHFPSSLRVAIELLFDFADADGSGRADEESTGPAGEARKAETNVAQIADIIGWLPILSADSDVDEATFNQLDELAMEFSKLHEKHGKASSGSDDVGWLRDFVCKHREPLQQAYQTYRLKTIEPDDENPQELGRE